MVAAGKASSDREAHKMFVAEGFRCEPLVIEALGRFGDRTRELFNEADVSARAREYWMSSFLP
jgi:hypothetical protein